MRREVSGFLRQGLLRLSPDLLFSRGDHHPRFERKPSLDKRDVPLLDSKPGPSPISPSFCPPALFPVRRAIRCIEVQVSVSHGVVAELLKESKNQAIRLHPVCRHRDEDGYTTSLVPATPSSAGLPSWRGLPISEGLLRLPGS